MDITKLKPKRDIVIIKRIIPDKTESGLHLVNQEVNPSAYDRSTRKAIAGKVISTGPKTKDVKPGQEVILDEFHQLDIGRNFRDKDIIAIREKDILGIRE